MEKIIDITNKLDNASIYITIDKDKKYKVNNSFKALLKASALFENNKGDDAEAMAEAIEIILGKSAREEIENMSISNVKTIFTAMMAAVQGMSYEEMESRFQNEDQ